MKWNNYIKYVRNRKHLGSYIMKLSAIINIHDFLIAFNVGNKTDADNNIMVGSKLLISVT